MAPDTIWGGGEIDSPCHSLTHSHSVQPSAAVRYAEYQPVNCSDYSSIRTDFSSVLELDSSANLGRASHRHHPQVGPVHYICTTATP